MIDSKGNKIGWNSNFFDAEKSFLYSGDMTIANPEATELLYRKNESDIEGIVKVNPYFSKPNAKYKLFFAQEPIKKLQINYSFKKIFGDLKKSIFTYSNQTKKDSGTRLLPI
jgi:hypothetical protein